MRPSEFWDYSLAEVNDLLESQERKREKDLKTKTLENCQLGYIVAGNISRFMNQNVNAIKPWDIYPELFEEEKKLYEIKREKDDLETYKQRKREYAAMVNAKRREV